MSEREWIGKRGWAGEEEGRAIPSFRCQGCKMISSDDDEEDGKSNKQSAIKSCDLCKGQVIGAAVRMFPSPSSFPSPTNSLCLQLSNNDKLTGRWEVR